jgi:hypothetical protein
MLATIFYLAPETIPSLQAYQLPHNQSIIKLSYKENLLF